MKKDYTVYLTKSREVSILLQKAHEPGRDNVTKVCSGCTDSSTKLVPDKYRRAGVYYCAVTRELGKPGYRFEIA